MRNFVSFLHMLRARIARVSLGLFARLFVFAVVPMLMIVGTASTWLLSELESVLEDTMQRELETVARALRLPLAHAVERGRQGSMERALESAFSVDGVYGAHLYDGDGMLLAALGEPEDPAIPPLVATQAVREERSIGRYDDAGPSEVYAYSVPLIGLDRDPVGMLRVTRRASDIRGSLEALRRYGILVICCVGTLLGCAVLAGYHGSVGRALGKLRRSMERIQSRQSQHRASPAGPPELKALAVSFNSMLDAMAEADDRLRWEQSSRDELERRLRHTEKLAAIGQLAAGVAHELGTPLAVVAGRAQRCRRHFAAGHAAAADIESIRFEVARMERLVRQLLDYGRAEPRQRVRAGAVRLATSAISSFEAEKERRDVQVVVDGPSSIVVLVDPARLQQALVNLVKNAVQAAERRVRITVEEQAGGVVFNVDDDGPGLPPGMREKVFEPFFTTKGQRGTGLGLAIAQSVVREHDGNLRVGMAPAGGARFSLWLPGHGLDQESADV